MPLGRFIARMRAATIGLAVCSTACDEEASGAAVYGSAVVWSDDDTMLLIAERDFEFYGYYESSMSRLLLLDPASGAVTIPLGQPREGVVAELYLMMGGWYALAWFTADDGTSDLVQTFLWGEERVVVVDDDEGLSDCDRMEVVPSPNAEMIAQRFSCGSNGYSEHVIIDAFSLDTIFRIVEPSGFGMWTPAGDYLVFSPGRRTAGRWTPGTAVMDTVAAPSCLYPRTNSSPIKETGEYVAMADVNEPPYVVHYGEHSRRTSFGCL